MISEGSRVMGDNIVSVLVLAVVFCLGVWAIRKVRNACDYCGSWRIKVESEWFADDSYGPDHIQYTRTCKGCSRREVRTDWLDRGKWEKGEWQPA